MTLSEQLNAMQAVLQQVSSELKEMQMQVEKRTASPAYHACHC